VLASWAPTLAGIGASLQFSTASTQILICVGMLSVIAAGWHASKQVYVPDVLRNSSVESIDASPDR
jgi:hypothetical protein